MADLSFGIATIIFSGLAYWLAWRKMENQNIVFAVSLLILGGLMLRGYVSADFFLHSWDERYHALVAKNLINHPFTPTLYDNPILPYDSTSWTANHIWLHKQPLSLWAMALSLWTFGINEIALRLPSILLTSIGILLTFQIGLILFNQKVGFIAAFLYSIHGLIIEVTGGRVTTDHVDVFFLFFIELAVLMSLHFARKGYIIYNILCGVSIGAAILSKWLPALIVLPIWLLFVLYYQKFNVKQIVFHFSVLIAIILAIALPWQIYIHKAFPIEASWESLYNFKHLNEVIEKHSGPFYYHFDKMRILYGELIYIPIVWFLYKTFRDKNNLKRWALLVWIIVPFLFFSLVKTKMQGYTLFTAPAIFIITALFWQYLITFRNRFKYKWLIKLVLFLLLALPVRYSIERIKPFSNTERSPQWVQDLKNLNKKHHDKECVIFNSDSPIETMFYTDFIAYEEIPDINILDDLTQKGFNIYIYDHGELPEKFKSLEKIEIIKATEKQQIED